MLRALLEGSERLEGRCPLKPPKLVLFGFQPDFSDARSHRRCKPGEARFSTLQTFKGAVGRAVMTVEMEGERIKPQPRFFLSRSAQPRGHFSRSDLSACMGLLHEPSGNFICLAARRHNGFHRIVYDFVRAFFVPCREALPHNEQFKLPVIGATVHHISLKVPGIGPEGKIKGAAKAKA